MNAPMTAERLYETLRPIQEKLGYFFNQDNRLTLEILEQLLINKERFGYMACPCRLANGDVEEDKDILCPCAYRKDDVAEFGTCYCGLYVSADWNAGRTSHDVYVPERRPAANIRR